MKKKHLLLIPFLVAVLLIFLVVSAQVRWRSIGKLTWINIGCFPFTSKYFECVYYERNLVFFQNSSAPLDISVVPIGYLKIIPTNHKKGFFNSLLPDCNYSLSNGAYYYDVQKKHFVDKEEYRDARKESGYPSYDTIYLNFHTLTVSGSARVFYKDLNEQFAEQVKSLP